MDAPLPTPSISHTKETTEYIYEPPRRSVRIQEGDWDRWIRCIGRIPRPEAVFRDIAFAAFGVSVPTLISSAAIAVSNKGTPTWQLFIYLVPGLVSLAVGGLSLLYDHRIGAASRTSVSDLLQDMGDVRGRAAVSEEQVRVPSPIATIG